MNRRLRELLPVFMAFACLLCMAMVFLYAEGDDRENVRTLQLKEAYHAQKAYELQLAESRYRQESEQGAEEPAACVFWGETQGVCVNAPELNRSSSAARVTVCGDSRIIFNSSCGLETEAYTLNGSGDKLKVQNENQEKECLISPALALELFGNTDGSGQRIQLEEVEYRVKGMLNCENSVVVAPAVFHPDAGLDKVSVRLADNKSTGQKIQDFTARTGIQGDVLAYHLYRQWTKFMAYAVPFLIYLIIWIKMLRRIKKGSSVPAVGLAVFVTAFVTGAVIGIWLLDVHIEIPREMLPSMWSDFEFWAEQWKSISGELALLMKAEKSEMVLQDYHNFLRAGGYSLAAVVLGYFSFRHLVIKNGVFLWTAAAGAMITTYLFFAVNMQSSVRLAHNRVLWVMMPVCFIMKYIGREGIPRKGIEREA